MSVSPFVKGICVNEVDSDADDEGGCVGDVALAADAWERIRLEGKDAVMKKLVDPKLPSQAEVDRHCVMGHLPFRSWCLRCVKAKGREADHVRDEGKERTLPEYSLDY
jgi:hypothetical protein